MVVSARVAVRLANWVGSSRVASVAWNVAKALLNVLKAETSAVSEVLLRFRALVSGAALAVVSDVTMLLMSRPDPIPVDEMTVLMECLALASPPGTDQFIGPSSWNLSKRCTNARMAPQTAPTPLTRGYRHAPYARPLRVAIGTPLR